MMCIGNHIPFNVPPEAIKRYLDLSAELACSLISPSGIRRASVPASRESTA